MTASAFAITAGYAAYHDQEQSWLSKYLAKDSVTSLWLGGVAKTLGLIGRVERNPLENLLRGLSPDGTKDLVKLQAIRHDRQHRPGHDLTFSPPKSFSTLWASLPQRESQMLLRIMWQATKKAFRHAEATAAFTRRGKGGRRHEHCELVGAAYLHVTNRLNQPQVHIHTVVPNMTLRADGTSGTIISRRLYEAQRSMNRAFLAEMARHLQRLGIRLEPDGETFRIAAVPRALDEAHSTRRAQVKAAMRERGAEGPKAAEAATLATRRRKVHVPFNVLSERWRQAGLRHGFGPEQAAVLIRPFLRHAPIQAVALGATDAPVLAADSDSRGTARVAAGTDLSAPQNAVAHAARPDSPASAISPRHAEPIHKEESRGRSATPVGDAKRISEQARDQRAASAGEEANTRHDQNHNASGPRAGGFQHTGQRDGRETSSQHDTERQRGHRHDDGTANTQSGGRRTDGGSESTQNRRQQNQESKQSKQQQQTSAGNTGARSSQKRPGGPQQNAGGKPASGSEWGVEDLRAAESTALKLANDHRHYLKWEWVEGVLRDRGQWKIELESALRHIMSDTAAIAVVRVPGTVERTELLKAAHTVWKAAGMTPLVVARKGAAAESIGAATEIEAMTAGRLAYRSGPTAGELLRHHASGLARTLVRQGAGPFERIRLGDTHVVAIDNAQGVPIRTLRRVLGSVYRKGGKIILLEDASLPGNSAGRKLIDHVAKVAGKARLTAPEVEREPWVNSALEELGRREVANALRQFALADRLHVTLGEKAAKSSLIEHWLASPKQGDHGRGLIITRSDEEAKALNRMAQKARFNAGELGSILRQRVKGHWVRRGDRVRFTARSKARGFRDGDFGTVVRIRFNSLTVQLDRRRERPWNPVYFRNVFSLPMPHIRVTLQPRHYRAMTLGYAAPIELVQGSRVDNAHVLASNTATDPRALYSQIAVSLNTPRLFAHSQGVPKEFRSRMIPDPEPHEQHHRRTHQQRM